MPRYIASISLVSETVVPGEVIEGTVTYTPTKRCTLKGAELQLVCDARYFHQANSKKKSKLDRPPITISLLREDEQGSLQTEEPLREVNKPTVFRFRQTLPPDLLPSTDGECRNTLSVSYVLRLTHQGVFWRRIQDACRALTVSPVLDLSGRPFDQVADQEVSSTDTLLGQGFDLTARATLPRYGWGPRDIVHVQLQITRLSSMHSLTATASLERNIRYKEQTTCTDIATSATVRVKSGQNDPPPEQLMVNIPQDTLLTGVPSCTTLSVRYRIRVDIKSGVNDIPKLSLSLPIVIGTRRQQLGATCQSLNEDSKPGPLRGPQSCDSRAQSSHNGPQPSSRPGQQSSRKCSAQQSSRNYSAQQSSRQHSNQSSTGCQSAQPSSGRHTGQSSSGFQSGRSGGVPHHSPQPPAQPRTSRPCPRRQSSSEDGADWQWPEDRARVFNSASTQTVGAPMSRQPSQQPLHDDQPPSYGSWAASQQNLYVVNSSSQNTGSSSTQVSQSQQPSGRSSFESSGPAAMRSVPGIDCQTSSCQTSAQPDSNVVPKRVVSPQPSWETRQRQSNQPTTRIAPPPPYHAQSHDRYYTDERENKEQADEQFMGRGSSDREPLCPPRNPRRSGSPKSDPYFSAHSHMD